MAAALTPSLSRLLRDVSRSFFLTLRVLPGAVQPQIGLAYLLARTSDTIADTKLVPIDRRLEALRWYQQQIQDRAAGPSIPAAEASATGSQAGGILAGLASHQGPPAERILLERQAEILGVLAAQPAPDRQFIAGVLATITSGQVLDLERFGGASEDRVTALRNDAELDDYTYRVAGCVGEFWTHICTAHLFHPDPGTHAFLLDHGRQFGQGLQLVNILRDLPGDLRQGRCYLPQDALARAGLAPADLQNLDHMARFKPVYDHYLGQARTRLQAGWSYTLRLPRRQLRLRLACAWPVLIGLKTLDALAGGNVLDARQRIKVPRAVIRQILLKTILLYPFRRAWESQAPRLNHLPL